MNCPDCGREIESDGHNLNSLSMHTTKNCIANLRADLAAELATHAQDVLTANKNCDLYYTEKTKREQAETLLAAMQASRDNATELLRVVRDERDAARAQVERLRGRVAVALRCITSPSTLCERACEILNDALADAPPAPPAYDPIKPYGLGNGITCHAQQMVDAVLDDDTKAQHDAALASEDREDSRKAVRKPDYIDERKVL